MNGRAADRSHQQAADTVLKGGIGLEADRVFVVFGLQKLIDVRGSEGGIASEIATQVPLPVTLNDRLQNVAPAIGAVDVAGAKRTAFQIGADGNSLNSVPRTKTCWKVMNAE